MTRFDELYEAEPFTAVTWRGMTVFRGSRPQRCECCFGDAFWYVCFPIVEDLAFCVCGPTCWDQLEQLKDWKPAQP